MTIIQLILFSCAFDLAAIMASEVVVGQERGNVADTNVSAIHHLRHLSSGSSSKSKRKRCNEHDAMEDIVNSDGTFAMCADGCWEKPHFINPGDGEECEDHEFLDSWSMIGPEGPQGPQGTLK